MTVLDWTLLGMLVLVIVGTALGPRIVASLRGRNDIFKGPGASP